MRKLEQWEVDKAFDDNYESEFGCIPVEMTISEMAGLGVVTGCGSIDQENGFEKITNKGFGDRRARGWFLEYDETFDSPSVFGMFHIECDESEAEKISDVIFEADGSLRPNGKSMWEGFFEFEIE